VRGHRVARQIASTAGGQIMPKSRYVAAGAALAVVILSVAWLRMPGVVRAQAPAAQSGSRTERTTWYFYRVKWGHQDEFVDLFKKNHLPVLKEEIKAGRMTSVRTFVPTYHGDGRADWTFAVVITFRDAAAMMAPSGEDEIVRR